MEGRLEAVVDGRAIGWAWDPEQPDEAVEVEILVDGEPVAMGIADVERSVLAEAGIGTGHYGFDLQLPEQLSAHESHSIRVTAGPDRVAVLPFEGFETISRFPDGPWEGTTFVVAGGPQARVPFVPEDEPTPDPGEAALVGQGGWLFLADRANLAPAQLGGAPLLSDADVEARAEEMVERHRRMRQLRIPYMFAVAPMKERLCGKLLPEGASLHPGRPVPQLNAVLMQRNGGDIVDLHPILRQGGSGREVFPRTGSEWNDRGAFFAYRALMKEAGKRAVELGEPLLEEEAHFSTRPGFRGDLADKTKVALAEGSFTPVEAEGDWEEEAEVVDVSNLKALRMPAPSHLEVTRGRAPHLYEVPGRLDLPRAVLVGPACCLQLIPWLAEHFSRFVFLWTHELPLETLELEMPHVVIHVVPERLLIHGQ